MFVYRKKQKNKVKMCEEEAEVMEDLGPSRRIIIQRWKRRKKWIVI